MRDSRLHAGKILASPCLDWRQLANLNSSHFFSVNPAVQVAEVQEDTLPGLDMREVAAPDHLPDGPITHGEVAGRVGERAEPAGESGAGAAGPLPGGGRIG